jgi:hypothetical protein
MSNSLSKVFAELLREVDSNPQLRERIERHFTGVPARADTTPATKRRNRRNEPAVDPYSLLQQGEQALRAALEPLDLEQLKDVISAFSLDSARLALKWKDRQRMVELIVSAVRTRLAKGDAFRNEPTAT